MPHLFGPAGRAALAATMARRPLLAFDFDGTLAPIVARPEDARLSEAVASRLSVLASRLPLAIVTGRSIDDVRGRLGFQPGFIVGNHGSEADDTPGDIGETPEMSEVRLRLSRNANLLSSAGVSVEDKGGSIALHYRLSRTREQALRIISELLDGVSGKLRVFGGKMVVNVMPGQAPDKADAVRRLLERCGAGAAFFAGDDVNDEPVFAAATRDWLTVRVGRDEPQSRAMYFLDTPAEVAMMLEQMILALQAPPPG